MGAGGSVADKCDLHEGGKLAISEAGISKKKLELDGKGHVVGYGYSYRVIGADEDTMVANISDGLKIRTVKICDAKEVMVGAVVMSRFGKESKEAQIYRASPAYEGQAVEMIEGTPLYEFARLSTIKPMCCGKNSSSYKVITGPGSGGVPDLEEIYTAKKFWKFRSWRVDIRTTKDNVLVAKTCKRMIFSTIFAEAAEGVDLYVMIMLSQSVQKEGTTGQMEGAFKK